MIQTMANLQYPTSPGPIAVFDSGYGGLTVLKELLKEFPEYDFIYLGDNARAPYGDRSFDVVYKYTLEAVKFLFQKGAHLVILACNTASAKALRTIQQNDLPKIDPNRRVLGVIRPSVEAVAEITKSKNVGVVGTEGTVASQSYPLEIEKSDKNISVFQEACPLWVPIVENNEIETPGSKYFIEKNINNLLSKSDEIDTIILGCTHYPLLLPLIKEYVPQNIQIISQGQIVAQSLKDYLNRHPEIDEKIVKQGRREYFTTELSEKFDSSASIFLEKSIKSRTVYFNHLNQLA